MELRPYQEEARTAVHEEWNKGRKHTLIAHCTGAGKTITAGAVIKDEVEKEKRVLFLAHREELLNQAQDKLRKAFGLSSALEKAESHGLNSNEQIVVASVQTLNNDSRLRRCAADAFQTIMVDEAHHILAEGHQNILNYFGGAEVLGLTATPDRGDKRNLGIYFDSLAHEYSIRDAIKDGYLCPILAQMVPLKVDLSKAKTSLGDYTADSLGNCINPYLHEIAVKMKEYCQGRKTVVFTPLIETSNKLVEELTAQGMKAVEIDGKSTNRAEILEAFEKGEYEVIVNSMLLTEGWDCPCVDCVVVLRPTKVRSLYQQMIGRGTRLYPGKENLLLLDFLWMTEKHNLCKPSGLLGRDEAVAAEMDRMVCQGEPVSLLEAEDNAERNVLAERESKLAKTIDEMRHRKTILVDPLQYALSITSEALLNYEPTFAWEYESPSVKQLACLERNGIDTRTVLNRGMASMLIDKLATRRQLGLATPKQIRCLEKYGFKNVGNWSFECAGSMIKNLANNNWIIPSRFNPELFIPEVVS